MSRTSQPADKSASARGLSRGIARFWTAVATLLFLAVTSLLVSAVVVARASESEAFRQYARAKLAHRLQADVSLGPVDSRALVFLHVPEIKVLARDQRWAVILQDVSLELDWRLLLRREWSFRSIDARLAEVWLGTVPAAVPETGAGPSGRTTEAPPMPEATDLPAWLSAALLQGRAGTEVNSIRVGELHVRGPVGSAGGPAFELTAAAQGRYARGRLEWSLRSGTFRGGWDTPWTIIGLDGAVEDGGWRVETGELQSDAGARVGLKAHPESRPGELAVDLTVANLEIGGDGGTGNELFTPFRNAKAGIEGTLVTRFPDVDRFRLDGTVRGRDLDLATTRIFELLASQTGEEGLTRLKSREATGKIEWKPGLIRLYDLKFEEPDLVRLEGRLSVVATEMAGIFDLQLPASLVGRFPGGKPEGFSYPAGGWSRAQLRVKGALKGWTEDLTPRLIEQIPGDIGVGPGPQLGTVPEPVRPEAGLTRRMEQAETVFNRMIRSS